ncbi:MAG: ABC transporter permease, partial [Spirochaetota bacterium]
GVSIVTEKNIRIYYTKAPVMIFGLLFPLFMFLAFYLGREVEMRTFFPGLLAMSLFFTSSSVGPLITPWEKQAGTHERLLSFPISVGTIILGDVAAGMIFGITVNSIVLASGMVFLHYQVNVAALCAGIIVGSFSFSSLGVLLASPSVRSPSHIMMLSSLIRFPLIFVSGIFIPLSELQGVGKVLCFASPLTYLVDVFNFSTRGHSFVHPLIDYAALAGFSLVFLLFALVFHRKNLIKGR